jgi:hypothetical protein
MCDTGSILGDVFNKLDVPGAQTAKKAGDLFDKATPILKAGVDSYRAISTSKAAEKQAGVRMAQVAYGANVEAKQTEQMQERRLGANRAAFAKSGIKVTGSARRLLDEQIKQDEIELLKIRHNRDVNMSDVKRGARMAQQEAKRKTAEAFGSSDVYGAVKDIFGLG